MDKIIRLAVIGTGGRGIEAFAREIVKSRGNSAKIVALCDPNPVRLAAAAKSLAIDAAQFTSVGSMLSAMSQKIDAAIITSPDFAHESNALEMLQAGIHCLIDKPLAVSYDGCNHIIQAAEVRNLTAMIGFNLRHNIALRKAKELIDSGVLGQLFLIENREFYCGGRTYMARWNRFRKNSGGLWIHKGCHDFDIFNWFFNFPKPIRVSAVAATNVFSGGQLPFQLHSGVPCGPTCPKCPYQDVCPDRSTDWNAYQPGFWGDDAIAEDGYSKETCIYTSEKDVHDNGITIVEYENGIKASHLECFICSRRFDDRYYTVIGDRGMMEIRLRERIVKVYPRFTQEVQTFELPEESGGHGGADMKLLDYFLKVLQGKEENRSTLAQGRLSTAIGLAAEIAWREHRTVEMSEITGNDL